MKTYPLTPQQFDTLRSRLLEEGVTLPAEAYYGQLSFKGITLKYNYDGVKLTLSVMQKPFLIPAAMIWEQVDKWIAA